MQKGKDQKRKAGKAGHVCLCRLAGMLLCAGILTISGCKAPVQRFTAAGTAMGTVVSQTVYTSEEGVTEQVMQLLTKLEQDTLSWREEASEVAAINGAAGSGTWLPLSEKMQAYLEVLLSVSEESGGAFDVTMGAITRLWQIDTWAALPAEEAGQEKAVLPKQAEIQEALEKTGYEGVRLSPEGIQLPEGMRLDLGAAGKGIACDEILAMLEQNYGTAVSGAVISVGGSILTYGEKPDQTPFLVAVADPFGTKERAGVLTLQGQWCVSTSGDYERYFEADGKRYHHIMDPATGYPADSGVRSVTVVCKSGILSDALSTACFVLGTEKGLGLAEAYGAEALFIRTDGSFAMTEGMKTLFCAE